MSSVSDHELDLSTQRCLGLTLADERLLDEIVTNFTLEDSEEMEMLAEPRKQPRYRAREEQGRPSEKIRRTKPRQSEW